MVELRIVPIAQSIRNPHPNPHSEDTYATDVVMPQMGESIAEGTIVRWIKKVGDTVDRDEPLFEISTDKVDAEIPSPAAGVVTEIRVKEGETVPVNSVVAVIGAGRRRGGQGSAADAGGAGSQSAGAAEGDAASGWIADRGGAAEGAGSARAVALPRARRSAAAAEGCAHLRAL